MAGIISEISYFVVEYRKLFLKKREVYGIFYYRDLFGSEKTGEDNYATGIYKGTIRTTAS